MVFTNSSATFALQGSNLFASVGKWQVPFNCIVCEGRKYEFTFPNTSAKTNIAPKNRPSQVEISSSNYPWCSRAIPGLVGFLWMNMFHHNFLRTFKIQLYMYYKSIYKKYRSMSMYVYIYQNNQNYKYTKNVTVARKNDWNVVGFFQGYYLCQTLDFWITDLWWCLALSSP